jgi:hypothetical protein
MNPDRLWLTGIRLRLLREHRPHELQLLLWGLRDGRGRAWLTFHQAVHDHAGRVERFDGVEGDPLDEGSRVDFF